ncbi:PqqD family peptide modification chaperone [Bradyrhizobium sp. 186]|uniref:PqqD family peptide modification chaperone n=1 Tax=Bradyrhizobium sp. 186 TaxID=2782654 RepID=UPI002001762A|nr:PqqD family peptide modification chaperone [Bradyrhizobium sp. 186]
MAEAVLGKSSPENILRPAADALFALLDGRSVLFSETKQTIYELDQVGAFIWCRLVEDASLDGICQELGKLGIDERTARQFTHQAMNAWLDRGLLNLVWRMSTHCALSATLGRRRISIRGANRDLLKELACLFCAQDHGADDDIVIEVMAFGNQVYFRGDDARVQRCGVDALAPTIKAYLTDRIIRSDHCAFALHAASLTKGDMGLLLCGEPGAGKSTLTLELMDAGFQYAGDDVALIGADGMISGIPFALTLKAGSWGLLSRLYGDWKDVTHCRSDGAQVRYLPIPDAHNGCLSASWIIFLNRVASGSVELTALDQLDSMKRLIESAFAVDGRMSQAGFFALRRIVAGARSFQLTYCESAEARGLLMDLCNGKA